MKDPLALRAALHIKKHELFFGFQRLGIKNSALARAPVLERNAAVGAGFGKLDAYQPVDFVRLKGLATVSLVSVSGTALE